VEVSGSLRPLYLTSRASLRVDIDGPSLAVRQPARAAGRYPLNRLCRVVSGIHVDWGSDAILACMRAGVPVFFLDGHGKAIGSCHGERRREATLANLIALAADVPDCGSRLEDWFRASHHRQAEVLASALCLRGMQQTQPDAVHDRAVNVLRDRWSMAPGAALRAYSALIRPWVEELLMEQLGGDTAAMAWPVPGIHLGERFATLLAHDAPRLLVTARSPTANDIPLDHWAAATFQNNLFEHARVFGHLLGRFEHWVREHAL